MSDCSTNWKLPKAAEREPNVLYMPQLDVDGVREIDARGVRFVRVRECHAIAIYNMHDEWSYDKCSACDCEWYEDELNFCPHCGARVRGGGDD